MEATHALITGVQSIIENTTGFDIKTKCKSVFISNTGEDAAKLFFNGITDSFYYLKPGATLAINSEETEIINDEIKIEFESNGDPIINIVKQIKTLL